MPSTCCHRHPPPPTATDQSCVSARVSRVVYLCSGGEAFRHARHDSVADFWDVQRHTLDKLTEQLSEERSEEVSDERSDESRDGGSEGGGELMDTSAEGGTGRGRRGRRGGGGEKLPAGIKGMVVKIQRPPGEDTPLDYGI
jgi:hypothetical protein